MSMLSSMTDKLRKTADEISRFRHGTVDFLQLGVAMADAASQMRDAADTIDYLRNTCNDIQRDNEKLKALVRDMWHDGMCECDERGACTECEYGYHERMREAGIEVRR